MEELHCGFNSAPPAGATFDLAGYVEAFGLRLQELRRCTVGIELARSAVVHRPLSEAGARRRQLSSEITGGGGQRGRNMERRSYAAMNGVQSGKGSAGNGGPVSPSPTALACSSSQSGGSNSQLSTALPGYCGQ